MSMSSDCGFQAPQIVKEGIAFKLFVGFLVTSELRMHLKLSEKWKEHVIVQKYAPEDLQLVHFEEKDYFGYYQDPAYLQIRDVEKVELKIRDSLMELVPKYQPDSLMLYLFVQSFIL